MRLPKRKLVILLTLICLQCTFCHTAIFANEVSVMSLYTCNLRLSITYTGNTARCITIVNCRSDVKKIEGVIILKDNTTNKNIASWNVKHNGSSYYGAKSVNVKSGHTYTLSFTGTVHNTSGQSENVSNSVTRTN